MYYLGVSRPDLVRVKSRAQRTPFKDFVGIMASKRRRIASKESVQTSLAILRRGFKRNPTLEDLSLVAARALNVYQFAHDFPWSQVDRGKQQ